MQKLQIADADVTGIAIQQEIQRSEESRYKHRLHCLLLEAAGEGSAKKPGQIRPCQRLFKKMRIWFCKPRPQVAQSVPDEVRAFKETAPVSEIRRR